MEISSDNATMHAGGSINSNNGFNFQGRSVHHHVHNHQAQPGMSVPAKPQLRCPLPSPNFVGRREELRRLKEFFESELDAKRFALIGMGGCGKSQIASEFTHGFILKEKIYDPSMVFFVDGTSISTLEESYASIAQSKGVGATSQEALLWLSNIQEPSFILIDNVDNAALDLAAYMPRSLNTHILITTRLHDKGRQYASASDAFIDLDALPPQDAEELLVRSAMLQPGERKEAAVLVQELHFYALAIAQAGACIAFLHLTVDEYLERFRRLGTSLMDGKNDGVGSSALHGYSKVVRHTWELSYDQLPASSKALFNLCAFLHHTRITQKLFRKATEALKTYTPTILFSPAEEAAFTVLTKALESCQGDDGSFDVFTFGRCIGPILSLSLMRCDPITRVHSIHPLILDSLQCVVSDHLPTSLLLMLAINSNLSDALFLCHLLPHIDSVMTRFKAESSPRPRANHCHLDITEALSFGYFESGRYKEAEKMRLDVLSQSRRLLGEDHPNTVTAMHHLAWTWSQLGRPEEAKKMQLEALSQYRRLLGEDHPETITAMSNLAWSWLSLGRYEEAEKMQLDVLSQRRHLLGEDHPNTITAMSSVAVIWSRLGQMEEAEKMQLDILSQLGRLLGEDHPDTITAMCDLAWSWSQLGRYEEAEIMQLDVLSQRRRLLGEDHPDTITAMSNLAWSWSQLGRYEEAEKMQLDILSQRKRLLGEDHPATITAMSNLAWSWSQLGRYEEAEKMQLVILSERRRLLGEEHPDTITAMSYLAWSWSQLGRYEEAEKMQLNILSQYRRLLGEDHPHTITAMSNLAWSWSQLGRYEEAEKMQLVILSQRRRLLGEDHPHTITAMSNLAWSWSELGRYEEAEKMELDVLAQYRRLEGENHPDTITAMSNLAWSWSQLGRYEEAEKMQLDVLARHRRLLGKDHPETVNIMADLAVTFAHLQRYQEAEELCQEALKQRRRISGEDHSLTVLLEQRLTWIREASKRSTEEDSGAMEPSVHSSIDVPVDAIHEDFSDHTETHPSVEAELCESLAGRVIPFLPLLLVPLLVLSRRR